MSNRSPYPSPAPPDSDPHVRRYGTGAVAVAVERPGGVVGLLPGRVTVGCDVGRTVWAGVWVAAGLVGSTVGTGA